MSKVHKYEPLTKESWNEFLDNIPPQLEKPQLWQARFITIEQQKVWKKACKEYAESMGVKIEEDETH